MTLQQCWLENVVCKMVAILFRFGVLKGNLIMYNFVPDIRKRIYVFFIWKKYIMLKLIYVVQFRYTIGLIR